jgi:penicillin-binding protein 1A
VRNLYLGGDQHTLKQKIIEAKLAIDYNEHHSKRSILTSYLNSVPYGTVGGQTASACRRRRASSSTSPPPQLDLEQSALLAGLPQAPSQYNPFLDPSAARERRNEVLAKMAELHYISARRRPPPSARRWRSSRELLLRSAARTSSSNTCASSWSNRYGSQTRSNRAA